MPLIRKEQHQYNFPTVRRTVLNDLNSQALKPYPRWTPDEDLVLREAIRRLDNSHQEPTPENVFELITNWLEGWQRGIHAISRRMDRGYVAGFARDANVINSELARVALEEGVERSAHLRRELEIQERMNQERTMHYQNEVFHLHADNDTLRVENEQLARERDRLKAQHASSVRGIQGFQAYMADALSQAGASLRTMSQATPDAIHPLLLQFATYPVAPAIQGGIPAPLPIADDVEDDSDASESQAFDDN